MRLVPSMPQLVSGRWVKRPGRAEKDWRWDFGFSPAKLDEREKPVIKLPKIFGSWNFLLLLPFPTRNFFPSPSLYSPLLYLLNGILIGATYSKFVKSFVPFFGQSFLPPRPAPIFPDSVSNFVRVKLLYGKFDDHRGKWKAPEKGFLRSSMRITWKKKLSNHGLNFKFRITFVSKYQIMFFVEENSDIFLDFGLFILREKQLLL